MSNNSRRVWGFLSKNSLCIPMLVTEIDGKPCVTVKSTGAKVPWLSEYMQSNSLAGIRESHEPDEDPEYEDPEDIEPWWELLFGTKKVAHTFRNYEIARCCEKYELRINASLLQIMEDKEAIQNLKRMESIL